MSKYFKSIIYKIRDLESREFYYGSTTTPIYSRMARHRYSFRKGLPYKSNLLFEKYGIENCIIELVERYPCETKEELLKREGFYITNNPCVNKCVAGRTPKEYYENNKDKYKSYYLNNKERILKRMKEKYKKRIKENQ
jgi:hypothetical protein